MDRHNFIDELERRLGSFGLNFAMSRVPNEQYEMCTRKLAEERLLKNQQMNQQFFDTRQVMINKVESDASIKNSTRHPSGKLNLNFKKFPRK